ncbi:putative hydrolase [Hyphodiscus hymeniophilus]|uniref:Hydrolase n=1 Tax=Hyphodiscus hymeniophilus TaxID=353542 RepID=A0A9P6SN90_9HELO|nr:putative hydrolase [Hyphodiscus hymeniophilus]
MTTSTSKEPRRFAPLRIGADGFDGVPKLKGIVFDMDGTLCIPQNYMFAEMRSALGITKSVDILDHIYSLTPAQQPEAHEKIRAIERNAMSSQMPQPGLVSLMTYLESKDIPKGICTRNFETPVNHLLGKFLEGKKFEPIVTREFRPPKPHPAGILSIAKAWGLVKDEKAEEGDAGQLIMVGDSIDDMTAGYRAGAATVLLVNEVNAHLAEHEHTDLCISRLDELVEVLEKGFVGRIGKGEEGSDTKGRAEGVLREGVGESTLK